MDLINIDAPAEKGNDERDRRDEPCPQALQNPAIVPSRSAVFERIGTGAQDARMRMIEKTQDSATTFFHEASFSFPAVFCPRNKRESGKIRSRSVPLNSFDPDLDRPGLGGNPVQGPDHPRNCLLHESLDERIQSDVQAVADRATPAFAPVWPSLFSLMLRASFVGESRPSPAFSNLYHEDMAKSKRAFRAGPFFPGAEISGAQSCMITDGCVPEVAHEDIRQRNRRRVAALFGPGK